LLWQIRFVHQNDALIHLTGGVQHHPVVVIQRGAAVQHHQSQLCPLQSVQAPAHAHLFHHIASLSQTGRVDQPQQYAAQHGLFLHRVPGGAGDVGDDGAVIAQNGVEQGAFSCVWTANDGTGNTLGQLFPSMIGGTEGS